MSWRHDGKFYSTTSSNASECLAPRSPSAQGQRTILSELGVLGALCARKIRISCLSCFRGEGDFTLANRRRLFHIDLDAQTFRDSKQNHANRPRTLSPRTRKHACRRHLAT